MAVTAEMVVQESSVLEGKPAKFAVTYTNGGGAAVAVSSFLVVIPQGAPAYSSRSLAFGDGGPTIDASPGTLSANFEAVFYPRSPPADASATSWPFDVFLRTHFDDDTQCDTNTVGVQVTPITADVPVMPTFGSIRFDSNNQSALLPVLF